MMNDSSCDDDDENDDGHDYIMTIRIYQITSGDT